MLYDPWFFSLPLGRDETDGFSIVHNVLVLTRLYINV